MKKIENNELEKYIGKTFFRARLNLFNKKIDKANFEITKETVTDVQVFEQKNGEIVAKIFINGKLYQNDYLNIKLAEMYFTEVFTRNAEYDEAAEWNMEYAEVRGEWEDEYEDALYKECVRVTEEAYLAEIEQMNKELEEFTKKVNDKKERLLKKLKGN